MEQKHVHDIYQEIATEFHHTRFARWPCVKNFLSSLNPYSVVGDIGSGNGKYLNFRKDLIMMGTDISQNLLEIAKCSGRDVINANGTHLPFKSGCMDGIISIAVLHHLTNECDRLKFIQELVRVLKIGGRGFVTVWALEQENLEKTINKWSSIGNNDYLVPWKNRTACRYYHLFSKDEITNLFGMISEIKINQIQYEKSNWYVEFDKLF